MAGDSGRLDFRAASSVGLPGAITSRRTRPPIPRQEFINPVGRMLGDPGPDVAAKSGGVIVAAIAAVFTIGYVANMLGEDEDWLCSRSSPTNELPAAHRRRSNRPNSPACGAHRMETLLRESKRVIERRECCLWEALGDACQDGGLLGQNAAIGYQCRRALFGIDREVCGLALLALGKVDAHCRVGRARSSRVMCEASEQACGA
jgi:hypothetical protein